MDKTRTVFFGVLAAALLLGGVALGAGEPASGAAHQSKAQGAKHCTLEKRPAQSALLPRLEPEPRKQTPRVRGAKQGQPGEHGKMPEAEGNDWEVGEELC